MYLSEALNVVLLTLLAACAGDLNPQTSADPDEFSVLAQDGHKHSHERERGGRTSDDPSGDVRVPTQVRKARWRLAYEA